ncbi:hypothetical protein AGABI2DRAFT_210349 [Agaricus bisporus var. bisporus H97]|uniref:hypothetical protein n=1 Tax=Agaricus bisporus var. bisporus (strain H97 / ATCC MYA-4626 / FGSC 10389) TaxID=936046 RepID=UPI00029F5B13|nr:hypothetical protein AGABI2DRAFT_210349 [Agaricus bisporus var. bisporus H97]EKV43555.1 hypothetical protein AGABI2DRAFT_210349 [Agaricus bisporus var. bisporus H97]
MATVPLDLAPTPGFCVKSAAGPGSQKVFVNICYDKNVPPPPPADEATIKRAMNIHQDDDDDDGNYYVPVVVSQPRQDRDKAGNLALVIDCVYNSTLRSRTLREPDFKIFLVELALQRIEAQTSLVLSRQIGTPNIVAKGKLEPRRVWVPASGDKTDGSGAKNASIGIAGTQPLPRGVVKTPQRPMWTWKKEAEGQILIMVVVPQETPHEAIRSSTLDVEPRRLILHIPGSAKTPTLDLDVDLNKSDAEIVASAPENTAAIGIYGMSEGGDLKEPDNTLLLKRQRKFEVDMASAEWKVAEGLLVISV